MRGKKALVSLYSCCLCQSSVKVSVDVNWSCNFALLHTSEVVSFGWLSANYSFETLKAFLSSQSDSLLVRAYALSDSLMPLHMGTVLTVVVVFLSDCKNWPRSGGTAHV